MENKRKRNDEDESDDLDQTKSKKIKGYKHLGNNVFVCDHISKTDHDILNKIEKKIKPSKCDFYFRVKTKIISDMCKNIKISNNNANTLQIFIEPLKSNDSSETISSEDNFENNVVKIMIDCLNGSRTFFHEGTITGNMHRYCKSANTVHAISTTVEEIQKQLKIHSKSVFCYFSTDESDSDTIVISSYDAENNVKRTFFNKTNQEFVKKK